MVKALSCATTPARTRLGADDGFSLIEVMFSTVVLMMIGASLYTFSSAAARLVSIEKSTAQAEEQLGKTMSMLKKDLVSAGYGVDSGPRPTGQSGVLCVSPVFNVNEYWCAGVDQTSLLPNFPNQPDQDNDGMRSMVICFTLYAGDQTILSQNMVSSADSCIWTQANWPVNPDTGQLAAWGFIKGSDVSNPRQTDRCDLFRVQSVSNGNRVYARTADNGTSWSSRYEEGSTVQPLSLVAYYIDTQQDPVHWPLMRWQDGVTREVARDVVDIYYRFFDENGNAFQLRSSPYGEVSAGAMYLIRQIDFTVTSRSSQRVKDGTSSAPSFIFMERSGRVKLYNS